MDGEGITMNIIAVARGFFQLVILLAQISPQMVKLWRTWEKAKGKRLTANDRKIITETVKEAVKTKDTTELEALLSGTAVDK